jgi:FlaA1/EpsC-like NDP-sugar epimerase
MNILKIIGRQQSLFQKDLEKYEDELSHIVATSNFLVLGGAGSIGQAVTKEIFKRKPKKLHVVDISENNLVELVRDIRSSLGYIDGDFKTYVLNIGSWQFDAYTKDNSDFDYVLNLTALKHVRSEKDQFTLMNMIETNILNTIKTAQWSKKIGAKKYFAVSTDKAANPVNMMGASKRIMELYLNKESNDFNISTARFANVAFSDGSLPYGYNIRISKKQPIVAPSDVKRYFVTPEESGLICLFSAILGENRDIFFPQLGNEHLIKFTDIAIRFLEDKGYKPALIDSEDEARANINEYIKEGKWPCLFASSNTTGEKSFEEFYTENENIDLTKFDELGIVKTKLSFEENKLDHFLEKISEYKKQGEWSKTNLLELFQFMLPNFEHEEKNNYLDSKM